ncbi:MAG: alpha/beta hydrolase, partial [Gammaproteobacteria bacterium]|nr:alpha/beta hydrolase [Gammaproteobacteria bacterium]
MGDAAVPLWPNGAPGALGDLDVDCPQLTVHLPAPDAATGAGVIVAPGGGYRILASDHEGLQVARWLNRRGIAAFVLRYRVGERYHSSVSLLDGLRA